MRPASHSGGRQAGPIGDGSEQETRHKRRREAEQHLMPVPEQWRQQPAWEKAQVQEYHPYQHPQARERRGAEKKRPERLQQQCRTSVGVLRSRGYLHGGVVPIC